MVGVIEVIQFWILAVYGQRILGQIIGSDAEKIHLFGKKVANHHRRRCLNHNSQFHRSVGNSMLLQFTLYLFYNFLNPMHFLHRNHHRKHDGNRAVMAGPVNGPKLRLKHLRLLQTDTDCTVSHSRIFLFAKVKIVRFLVGTDIQCPDNHLSSRHVFCHCFIGLELFLFCGKCVLPQIQKLTAEKSDATGIIGKHVGHISHASDIGIEIYFPPICCHRFFSLQFLKKFLFVVLLGLQGFVVL